MKACEGLKAGGGVLLGLKADLKSSDPVPVSILSASLLSLKAGETVSEEKRGEAALALLRSLRGCLPRFVAGFESHGRPTLTWPVGRRKFLHIVTDQVSKISVHSKNVTLVLAKSVKDCKSETHVIIKKLSDLKNCRWFSSSLLFRLRG